MKVYEIVQELLLKSIASGTAPWHKPWAGTAINNGVRVIHHFTRIAI